jgi:hypothetical protein
MAFRIQDSVVRGEIDNRVKGKVTGQIWMEGRPEPVRLELIGNAHPDLAGCLLTFTNPQKRFAHQHLTTLNPVQRGTIGDLTASRKVRVFDIPVIEAYDRCKRGEKPPEHMANCLYLEWFSETNGRVVIESVDYTLEISAPEWRLTPEENEQRAREAAAGMDVFMQKLTDAIETQQRGQKDPEADWDEHDYEKFLKESDARTDKYLELREKYGDSDEAEARVAKEMGWDAEPEEDADGEDHLTAEEINRITEAAANEPPPAPASHREGIDWIRTADGDLAHPLQHRCFESAMKLSDDCAALGLEPADYPDMVQLLVEFQIASAKLAGALSGVAQGRDAFDPAFVTACLKRALNHLHQSQAGLEAIALKKLLPEKLVRATRQELFALREGILQLMDEFRGRQRD